MGSQLSCGHEGASHGAVILGHPGSLDPYRHADHPLWSTRVFIRAASHVGRRSRKTEIAAKRGHLCISLQGTSHALVSALLAVLQPRSCKLELLFGMRAREGQAVRGEMEAVPRCSGQLYLLGRRHA